VRHKTLLICGILSPILYAASDVVAGLRWQGYSFRDQTISELAAIGAPSRGLFVALLIVVYALMVAFGIGVWKSCVLHRRLELVGGLLIAFGVMSLTFGQFAAMQLRGVEQGMAGAMHVVGGAAAMLMIFTAMGIASTAFGPRFRLYTIVTIVLVLVFGAWAASEGPRIEQGLATPWVGVKERICWYGYQAWFAVLAVVLLRRPIASMQAIPGTSYRRKIVTTIAAVAGLSMTAVVVAYQKDIRPIRARILAGSTIAETAAGKIEYAVAGTGMPLLSIHGAGGGYDQGLLIAHDLFGDRFRVIAPSRFGYLRTPVPRDASPAAQAAAAAALLDVLGVDRAIVVGASAGAPSAMQLAMRHPERVAALILMVPRGYAPGHTVELDPTPQNRALFKVFQAGSDLAFWSILHVAPSMVVRLIGVPPEVLEKANSEERLATMRTINSLLPVSMRMSGIEVDSSARMEVWPLERIAAPTLIFSSSDDLFHTQPAAEYAAAHIPHAQLVVYPTGGHLLIGHSADVLRTVAAFIKRALR
jgi:pimeloyl-ACP methyl ester carboxylesterase